MTHYEGPEEDHEHSMVSCCDCGCEHLGEVDECPCQTEECEECGCDFHTVACGLCGCDHPWDDLCNCQEEYCSSCECDNSNPCEYGHCDNFGYGHDCCECGAEDDSSAPEDEGCAACHWWLASQGEWNPCDYGDASDAYTECAYFGRYLDQNTPQNDRHFAVVNITDAVEAHELDPGLTSEHQIARRLGLDPDLDLRMAVADFYILERLYEELWDRSPRYDAKTGRWTMDGLRLPKEFGSESRRERLAYEVANTRKHLLDELSNQFKLYLIMAVGGELRHAPSQSWRTVKRRGTPKKDWPKGRKDPWNSFPRYKDLPWKKRRYFGCAACSWMAEQYSEGYDPEYYGRILPCNRKYIKTDKDGKNGWAVKPAREANSDCGYLTNWARHFDIKVGKEERIPWQPDTPRLDEYFRTISGWNRSDSRGLAWREWAVAYSRYGPALIRDCANVFLKQAWGSSYGGPRWGQAAEFLFEFLSGKMSANAFLDRAFTLQHNGGCIFNKFYRRGLGGMMAVLDLQSNDQEHYPQLRKYASPYTRSLLGQLYPST
jgi:hypothetical protein